MAPGTLRDWYYGRILKNIPYALSHFDGKHGVFQREVGQAPHTATACGPGVRARDERGRFHLDERNSVMAFCCSAVSGTRTRM